MHPWVFGRHNLLLVGLLCVCQVACIYAQAPPEQSVNPADYVHTMWGTNEGLPQNTVNAIQQTRDGYIWLGTGGGLVRFDGLAFTVFDAANTSALTSNRILSLYEDREGTLWIATVRGGLVRYQERSFTALFRGRNVYSFLEDTRGHLWIGADDQIMRFTPSDTTIIPIAREQEFSVYGLVQASDSLLWVASNRGLYTLNTEHAQPELRLHPAALTRSIFTPLRKPDGTIWLMVASQPIYRFKGGQVDSLYFETTVVPPLRTKSTFLQAAANVLWIGTTDGLFYVEDGATQAKKFDHPALAGANVNAVFVDQEGILWVGTEQRGVHRFTPRHVQMLRANGDAFAHNMLALHESRAGGMWAGSGCAGLFYIPPQPASITQYHEADGLKNTCVWSLLEDHNETLWIGTWGDGLFYRENGRIEPVRQEALQRYETVLALHQSRDSSIWMGTFSGGVVRFKGDEVVTYTEQDGLASNDVRLIYEARDGSFWVGTTGGLSHVEGRTIRTYTTADGLAHNFVRAIHEDDEGTLWIGTYGGGLSRLKADVFVAITEADGLYDNTISRIFEDDYGYFWMSGNKGVTRVQHQALDAFADGQATSFVVSYYTESAGMAIRETNGGFQPAGWQHSDGTLWVPTQQGIAVLDPARMYNNSVPPPVAIEQIAAPDTVVMPSAASIQLSYRQRNLDITYAGLSFLEPHKVHFRYQLEPFDPTWNDVGTRRHAYYTNLAPGAYTFRVEAINNDGVRSAAPATFSFDIARPWWQHPLVYALYVFASVGVIMGVFRWRLRRLRWRQRELEQEVDAQVAQIKTQQNRLLILNEELQEKNTTLASAIDQLRQANDQLIWLNDEKNAILSISAHDLGNPLATIKGFTEILTTDRDELSPEESHEMLGYIAKSVGTMKHIVTNLTDLQRLERGGAVATCTSLALHPIVEEVVNSFQVQTQVKAIRLIYNAPEHEALPLAYADRHLFERILQNLISNALKFSEFNTEVTVGVESIGKELQVWVRDDGPGISKADQEQLFKRYARLTNRPTNNESSTGLGLSIVKAFVEMMNGRVWCSSVVGKGTTFYIALPRYTEDHTAM